VVASAHCQVLVLSGPFLQRFVGKHPTIAAKVMVNVSRILAARLAATTQQVVQARQPA
jgi:hypothetical protein